MCQLRGAISTIRQLEARDAPLGEQLQLLEDAIAKLQLQPRTTGASDRPFDVQVLSSTAVPGQPLLTVGQAEVESRPPPGPPPPGSGPYHAADCMEQLLESLCTPPKSIYCGLGGYPCTPADDQLARHVVHLKVVSAKLQLLEVLAHQLGWLAPFPQEDLHQQPMPGHDLPRPPRVHGIVEIIEVEEKEPEAPDLAAAWAQRSQQLLLRALLALHLHTPPQPPPAAEGADEGSRQSPCPSALPPEAWSPSDTSTCTSLQQLAAASLAASLELFSPWVDEAVAGAAQQLLLLLANLVRSHPPSSQTIIRASSRSQAATPEIGSGHSSSSSSSSSSTRGPVGAGCFDGPPEAVAGSGPDRGGAGRQLQVLILSALPVLAKQLHQVLRVPPPADKDFEIGPNQGPDLYTKCLAARQVAALCQQLGAPTMAAATPALLPLLLNALDEPSPAVQRYSHSGLHWLVSQVPGGQLEGQAELLLHVARRMVVGCEEGSWRTALPAAVAVVLAVERPISCRSPALDGLMSALLEEVGRSGHRQVLFTSFLAATTSLLPCLGLYTVKHLPRLMPLLLQQQLVGGSSQVLAAQLLGQVVRCCWPRMPAHAGVCWEVLAAVAEQEDKAGGRGRPSRECQAARQLLPILRDPPGAPGAGPADDEALADPMKPAGVTRGSEEVAAEVRGQVRGAVDGGAAGAAGAAAGGGSWVAAACEVVQLLGLCAGEVLTAAVERSKERHHQMQAGGMNSHPGDLLGPCCRCLMEAAALAVSSSSQQQ